MAEINIEKKKGMSIWAWLIPLLLILGLLWWLFGRNRGDSTAVAVTDTTMTATSPAMAEGPMTATGAMAASGTMANGTGAVDDFARFAAVKDANRDESSQHTFTAGGIRRLADALASRSPGASATPKLAEMRQQADALENSATASTRHADMARTAFLAAADVFAALPNASSMSVQVSSVRAAAEAMKGGPHLLEQKEKVDAFFAAASTALR